VGYRDEREALEAKVQELEDDLGEARRTIARLQGEGAAAQPGSDAPSAFLGAPPRLHLERELPFEVSDEGYEAIADILRARLSTPAAGNMGNVGQVGRTLTFQRPGLTVRIAREPPGKTRITLDDNHQGFGVLLGVGTMGTTFFGLVPVIALLKALAFTPAALIVALPLLILTCYAPMRALVSRHVMRERTKRAAVIEVIAETAARHVRPTRSRIAVPAAEEAGASEHEAEEAEALERADAAVERRR
jgi:Tfp pilus assembly protein FimV